MSPVAPRPSSLRAIARGAAAGDDFRMPTHSPIQYGTPIHSVTLSAPGVQGLTAVKDSVRALSDVSSAEAKCLRGASQGTGQGGRAHQKGRDLHRRHGAYFFARPNRLGNRLDGEFFLSRHPMDQREFPLLGRLDAPSAVPNQWIRHAKTYRQAVRLAWQLRRVQNLTRQQLATEAGLYPQHVTDYLCEDDKPSRRDLPADKVAQFEGVVGNTMVSQWLAAQSRLTVLEEMQATRAVA